MAKDANITKTAAEKALNSLVNTIQQALSRQEKVKLAGFGTYSIGRRAARAGRNPKTGEKIYIPAKRVVKFKPGSTLANMIK